MVTKDNAGSSPFIPYLFILYHTKAKHNNLLTPQSLKRGSLVTLFYLYLNNAKSI